MAKRTGLDNRSCDANGEIRHKRADTLVGTLRAEYGEDFGGDISSRAHLGTLLEREGQPSLAAYLKTLHEKK